jgi:hypothetical protein
MSKDEISPTEFQPGRGMLKLTGIIRYGIEKNSADAWIRVGAARSADEQYGRNFAVEIFFQIQLLLRRSLSFISRASLSMASIL